MILGLAALPLALLAAPQAEGTPAPLPTADEVGIDEHLGAALPLELEFVDAASGARRRLAEFFPGDGQAVLLTLNYSGCPQLCSAQLDGLVEGLRGVDGTAGADFRLVTVSIDPAETPATAAATRARYLGAYGRDGADWHFLTGADSAIATLAAAVGFRYRFVAETGEFAHVAAAFVLAPDGRIARYLYGIGYAPRTLQLSLAESAAGELRSTADRVLLYCFQYDPAAGSYTLAALKLVKLFGALLVVALGGFLLTMFRAERRNRKHPAA